MKSYFAYGIVICAILIISNVETNPGPSASQKSEIAEVKEILVEIRGSNEKIVTELRQLKGTVSQLVGRIDYMESEVASVKNELYRLQDYTGFLEDKLDDLENRSRRQNIVIRGVHEDEKESWEQTEKKVRDVISERLNISVTEQMVERAHRTGKRNPGRDRPIVCKLLSDKTKSEILKNCKKLRGSKIFIEQDYSYRVRAERQKLKVHMTEARKKGHYAYLHFRYLNIDGKNFSLNDLETDSGGESTNDPYHNTRRSEAAVSTPAVSAEENLNLSPSPPKGKEGTKHDPSVPVVTDKVQCSETHSQVETLSNSKVRKNDRNNSPLPHSRSTRTGAVPRVPRR